MLVIVTDNQLLSPQKVCCDCLMANREGLPRWQHGRLGCGVQNNSAIEAYGRSHLPTPIQRCQMGFQVADIN